MVGRGGGRGWWSGVGKGGRGEEGGAVVIAAWMTVGDVKFEVGRRGGGRFVV